MVNELLPQRENLPSELLALPQFIIWFEKKIGNKITKVPCAPWATGHCGAASATDPNNWTTFDNAIEYAQERDGYGVGFCFRENGGIVGIDFDHCIDGYGAVNSFAERYIEQANSYTELSVSKTGIHVFLHGKLFGAIKNTERGIEAYDRDRFFVLTGRRLKDAPLSLGENNELLSEISDKFGERHIKIVKAPSSGGKKYDIPWEKIVPLEKLRQVGTRLQGPHPIHGSEQTNNNFAIDLEKNLWFCYRHWHGGDQLSLLAQKEGILACEDCVPGALTGDKFKQVKNRAIELNLISQEPKREEAITDRQITDAILAKHEFYCDKDDENTTLYIWSGAGWSNGVAEGVILNELSDIFKDEENRYGMALDRTVNFIKGQAMNKQLGRLPPYIIAFSNGLYDVRSNTLMSHDPSIFYVNIIPHNLDPDATCPNWTKWLADVMRAEDIAFVQEWVGYQFYASYPEPGFLINLGKGQNGKSIFMDLLQKMIGEKNISNVSLSDVVNGPYAISELYNKLANISDEISNRAVRDAGLLKMVSSGSYIEARQIYGKHFNFRNYAKPTYACNEPPEFRDESDAIKYRLKAVEFPFTFRKRPKEGEKQARDKKEIEAELDAEIPGIINWALEGLRRLIANKFTFTESRSTEETWLFYKRKSNPVACFIEEGLEFTEDPKDVLSRDQMYQAFCEWLETSKVDLNVSRDKFFKGMKACGVDATQSREYDRQRVYIGVKCHNVTPKPTPNPPAQHPTGTQQTLSTTEGVPTEQQGDKKECDTVPADTAFVEFIIDHPGLCWQDPDDPEKKVLKLGPWVAKQICAVPKQLAGQLERKGVVKRLEATQ